MKSDSRFLAYMLLLLAIVDLAVWWLAGVLGRGSGLEMSDIAERIVAGYGFSSPYLPVDSGVPTAVSPPLYVGVVVMVYELLGVKTFASRATLQILNILFHSVALVLLYHWTRKCLDRQTARVFAVIFLLSPHVVFLASNVWESSLSLMFLCVALYVVSFGFSQLSHSGLVAFGVLLGLVALSNPAWTLAFPFLVLGACIQHFREAFWRRFLVSGLLIVTGYSVMVMPWMLRNHAQLGEWMYVRNMAGPEWFKGNNAAAGGGHGQGFVDHFIYVSDSERARYAMLGELAYDKTLMADARAEIAAAPLRYAGLTITRVAMWWSGDVDVARWYFREGLFKEFLMSLVFIGAGTATSVLAGWGAWQLQGRLRVLWPLAVYVFVLPIPYYFIIVGFRYQSSLLPFVLIFAAWPIARWLRSGR